MMIRLIVMELGRFMRAATLSGLWWRDYHYCTGSGYARR